MQSWRWLLAVMLAAVSASAQWEILPSGTTADLRGIDAVGNGVAWASGTQGTVLRTLDDGKTWQRCATPPGAEGLDFRGVQAFDATTAIVMSSGKGTLSRLYRTADGCKSWKLVFTNPDADGFWDAINMTDQNIGMLIGDPIPSVTSGEGAARGWVFPTYHTLNGGLTWKRNDHDRYVAKTDGDGNPSESIFAASNSAMVLVSYMMLFVAGGRDGALHYDQYTMTTPMIARETDYALIKSGSAGGFSIAANWTLGSYAPHSELHARALSSDVHAVVIVGGDYILPNEGKSTASACNPVPDGDLVGFHCVAAKTPPHGYRSAVAYDETSKAWITVGPNGTDVSMDDGRNWRPLRPDAAAGDAADADQHWNALSLPFVVGPHGRIGRLRDGALKEGSKK